MSDKESKNTAIESASDPKIDAIKQLIFGDNMAEYDKRFDGVIRELEKAKIDGDDKRAELDRRISEDLVTMKKDFEAKMEKMNDMFVSQIAKLEDKKADRKALGKMLQNIGEKLQA